MDDERNIINFRLASLENKVEEVEDKVNKSELEIELLKREESTSIFDGMVAADWVKIIILIFGLVSGSTVIADYLEGFDDKTREELIKILDE